MQVFAKNAIWLEILFITYTQIAVLCLALTALTRTPLI
jgi:hypothetical protein